jgi:hypothetical protein
VTSTAPSATNETSARPLWNVLAHGTDMAYRTAPVARKTAVAAGEGARFDHAYDARNTAPREGRSPSSRSRIFSENLLNSAFSLTP